MKTYDVVIIGAGTAGLTARREVAKKTENYLVVDPGALGTTCARVGCMPSKVLIQIANDFYHSKKLIAMGIEGCEQPKVNIPVALQHVRSLRDRFVRSVVEGMESWRKTHFQPSRARFLDPQTLEIDGKRIGAKTTIVAVGSKPWMPSEWQKAASHLYTTDDFFEQTDLPQNLGVLGMGVIGLELGQALKRIGFNVKAYAGNRRIGGLTDPSLQDYAFSKLGQELSIKSGRVEHLEVVNDKLAITCGGKTDTVDRALVAIGRRPAIENLGLETLGVELNQMGLPEIDKKTFKVRGLPIYFAGDALAERPILHEAADEGVIAGYNAVSTNEERFNRRTPLSITFSDPNIALVGETYEELRARFADFAIGEVTFEGQGRSIIMLKEVGWLRVYGDVRTKQLLGAEIFAPSGEHLAHLIASWISLGLTVSQTLKMPFYHPVVEEGLRTALRSLERQLHEEAPLEVIRCSEPPVETPVATPFQ